MAEELGEVGTPDSLEQRFQRWISNPRIDLTVCLKWWMRWVVSAFDHERLVLLVDETKLSNLMG